MTDNLLHLPVVQRAKVDLRTRDGWSCLRCLLRQPGPWTLAAVGRLARMAWRDTRGKA